MKKLFFILFFLSFYSISQCQTGSFIALLRYYNAPLDRHYLTTNPNEPGLQNNAWHYEKTLGYVRTGTNPLGGNLYSWYNTSNSAHILSLSSTPPPGYRDIIDVKGNVDYAPFAFTPVPITEYYNPKTGDYCYTNSLAGENLGSYVSHGVVFTISQYAE